MGFKITVAGIGAAYIHLHRPRAAHAQNGPWLDFRELVTFVGAILDPFTGPEFRSREEHRMNVDPSGDTEKSSCTGAATGAGVS